MSKHLMECSVCKNRFKTKKPVTWRICPVCKTETDFEVVKKTVKTIGRHGSFHILCCRCQAQFFIKNGSLPKQCPACKHPFKHHSENITITDVIYNIITGSDSEEKGYLRVDVAKDGTVWWKGDKDAYNDKVCPFIGASARVSQNGYRAEPVLDAHLQDDLKQINFQLRRRRF